MKKLIIAIFILSTINLNAKTTSLYQHARDMRLSNSGQQNIGHKRLFFAKRAARRGNPMAQFDLAMMYASGDGVIRDEKIAFNWFHKAARNGHIRAKYYMGLSFLQGRGVKKQLYLARYWFKLAYKAGYHQAFYHLTDIEKNLFRHPRS